MTARRFVGSFLVPIALGVVFAAPNAQAQAAPRTVAEAYIPFAFEYSGKVLPAGHYQIQTFKDDFMVVVGGSQSTMALIRRDDPLRAVEDPKLIFGVEGDDVVLKDVWVPSIHAHLVCSRRKQAKRQEFARSGAAASTLTIAAVESRQ